MVPPELLNRVVDDVTMHCRRAKGYEEGPWVNPMMPVDCVSAFAMARCLTEQNLFDHYLAVAPKDTSTATSSRSWVRRPVHPRRLSADLFGDSRRIVGTP